MRMSAKEFYQAQDYYAKSGDDMGWLCYEYNLYVRRKHPSVNFKPTGRHYDAILQEVRDMREAARNDLRFH